MSYGASFDAERPTFSAHSASGDRIMTYLGNISNKMFLTRINNQLPTPTPYPLVGRLDQGHNGRIRGVCNYVARLKLRHGAYLHVV